MTPETLPSHIEEMCVILRDDCVHPVSLLAGNPNGLGMVDFWDKCTRTGQDPIVTVRLKDDPRTEDNSDTWDLLLTSKPTRVADKTCTALLSNGNSLRRVLVTFTPDGGGLIWFRE